MNTYLIFNFSIIIVFIFVTSILAILLTKKDKEKQHSAIVSGISTMICIIIMGIVLNHNLKQINEPPIIIETVTEPQIDTLVAVSNGRADSTFVYYFYQIVID